MFLVSPKVALGVKQLIRKLKAQRLPMVLAQRLLACSVVCQIRHSVKMLVLVAMTRVMSRHVVTIGAIFLIVCGLIPKIGGIIRTIPIEVLGGGVIVMFGMVVSAGLSILSQVDWTRRNMMIFAVALTIGFGLQVEPKAVQYLPDTLRIIMVSGLLPAAFIAIVLNLILPEDNLHSEV